MCVYNTYEICLIFLNYKVLLKFYVTLFYIINADNKHSDYNSEKKRATNISKNYMRNSREKTFIQWSFYGRPEKKKNILSALPRSPLLQPKLSYIFMNKDGHCILWVTYRVSVEYRLAKLSSQYIFL